MRTQTQTVRIGENMGPVDYGYDFISHFRGLCVRSEEARQKYRDAHVERLRRIEAAFKAGKEVKATSYGGWPRCGYGLVIDVGMYDGWPYWKPVPSVCTIGPLGGAEWHSFSSITNGLFDGEEF